MNNANTEIETADEGAHNPDDIVSIKVAMERLGSKAPAKRQSFHDAIRNGKLKNMTKKKKCETKSGEVTLRYGDVLEYIDQGGFKKRPEKKATKKCSAKKAAKSKVRVKVTTDDGGSTTGTNDQPDAGQALAAQETMTTEAISIDMVAVEDEPHDVAEIEAMLAEITGLPDDEILKRIKDFSSCAVGLARQAMVLGANALACAWACGTMLNQMKAKLGHGAFVDWLEKHLVPERISVRKCQRFMKIAKSWSDVHTLIEEQPGLMAAYKACGIISEDSGADDESTGKDDPESVTKPSSALKLLRSLSSVQKCMRLFKDSGEVLNDGEVSQIALVMEQLNRFRDQLRNSTAPEQAA